MFGSWVVCCFEECDQRVTAAATMKRWESLAGGATVRVDGAHVEVVDVDNLLACSQTPIPHGARPFFFQLSSLVYVKDTRKVQGLWVPAERGRGLNVPRLVSRANALETRNHRATALQDATVYSWTPASAPRSLGTRCCTKRRQ